MRFHDEKSGGYDDEGGKEEWRESWCIGSNDDGREPEPLLRALNTLAHNGCH